jgi:hypothetical protein
MPFCYQPYRELCQESWRFDPDSILLVDNTIVNKGIMRSHNMGIDKMVRDDTDWLIIMSAAIRFGSPGGLDFIDQLDKHAGYHVIEAAGVFGWHLIAFARDTINLVGRWDENFTPYGPDDIDYSLRFQRAYGMDGRDIELWIKVPVNALDAGMAHGLHLAGVYSDPFPKRFYFGQKWGRAPDDSHITAYRHPWNDTTHDIRYWPPVTVDGVTGHWDQPLEGL